MLKLVFGNTGVLQCAVPGRGTKGWGTGLAAACCTPMCGEAERRVSKKGERGGEEALSLYMLFY